MNVILLPIQGGREHRLLKVVRGGARMNVDPGTNWRIVGSGDFDGDGLDDLLWRNTDGSFSEWLGRWWGSFDTNHSDMVVSTIWQVYGTGDFDGDSRSDILWRNSVSGDTGDWFGNIDANFTINPLLNGAGSDWNIAGTGDFNGDFRSDILWRNNDGRIGEWFGTTGGNFSVGAIFFGASLDWTVAGTGYFNADPYSDIIWRNVDGRIATWTGGASGVFTSSATSNYATIDWKIVATTDVNGDGYSDLIWRNDNGAVGDWLGQSDGSFFVNDRISTSYVRTDAHVAATGDFNGDGYSDILWRIDGDRMWTWQGKSNGGFDMGGTLLPTAGSGINSAAVSPSGGDGAHFSPALISTSMPSQYTSVASYQNDIANALVQQTEFDLVNVSFIDTIFDLKRTWIPGRPGDGVSDDLYVNGGHFKYYVEPSYSTTTVPSYSPQMYISQPTIVMLLNPGTTAPPPSTPNVTGWDRVKDAAIDAIGGRDLANEFRSLPQFGFLEYASYTYRTQPLGELQHSLIRIGDSNSISTRLADYNIPNGAVIVAFSHSHPSHYADMTEATMRNYTDAGDVRFLQDLGFTYDRFVDHSFVDTDTGKTYFMDPMFRTYMITDTAIHEYDYVQNKGIVPPVPDWTPMIAIEGEYIPDFHL